MCYLITWYENEITANYKIKGFKIQLYQAIPAYNLAYSNISPGDFPFTWGIMKF